MALITFMSDFGTADFYVAATKAKILAHALDARIIDISHQIEEFNLIHAGFVLKEVLKRFPAGTVHLVSVKSELGPKEDALIIHAFDQWLVGTDNGLLSLIGKEHFSGIWRISSPVDSFPAAGLLAEIAAKLSQNAKAESLGTATDQIKTYMLPQVRASKQAIQAQIIHIDRYGNLITNVQQAEFDYLRDSKAFEIKIGRNKLRAISTNYADVVEGDLFALFNSMGLLEIGINEGRASDLLGLEYGSNILVEFI
jgi:S-adenosyl-L-methionine hydrolase (adenosine-forming)